MARIRTIKPQFWLDEQLGTICHSARLLYIGLWNLSDDQGVFEWRPGRIKVQLFPYDDIKSSDIETWLQMLLDTGDIIKFSENNAPFGYIPSFLKHQDIKKPSKWVFAKPPEANSYPPVTHQLPITTEPVLLGKSNREKEKLKVVGNREKESIKNPKKTYGEFQNVLLTDDELEKLKTKFNSHYTEKIENLSEYLKSKNKKYSSHYATILMWARKDEKDGQNGTNQSGNQKISSRQLPSRYTTPEEYDAEQGVRNVPA